MYIVGVRTKDRQRERERERERESEGVCVCVCMCEVHIWQRGSEPLYDPTAQLSTQSHIRVEEKKTSSSEELDST